MPEDNRTTLKKAEIAVSDFTSAGYLQPEQANKFIQLAIKKPVLLQNITVTPMKTPQEERDKMRFANRVLRAGTEATALPSAAWAKPDLGMMQLNAQLFRAETRLSDEVLEDQIERGVFKDTLIEELSGAIGRDMEWVAINGDTTSSDPTLAKLDGVLKQVTSNLVNGSSTKLSKTILRDMLRSLPVEFEDDDMVYFTNRQARIDYKDSLSDRATGLGDIMLESGKAVTYSDYPVIKVPEFPIDGSNNTQCVLCNPKGIYLGVYRRIKIKVAEDISAGVIIIVATVRFDVKLVHEAMLVKGYDIVGA